MVPTAFVILSFTQQLGGIVILSFAQNVSHNRLGYSLATQVPRVYPDTVLDSGTLGLINVIPENFRCQVVIVYNGALVGIFYIFLGLTCLVVLCTLGIEWKSIKEGKGKKNRHGSPGNLKLARRNCLVAT